MAVKEYVKVYPYQLDWCEGLANSADSSTACWRYILLSQDVKSNIHPVYKKIGDVHEGAHLEELQRDTTLTLIEKERPFLHFAGDVVVSGNVDYTITHQNGFKTIDECKATLSKSTCDKAPKDSQLYQTCLYLGAHELQYGRLVHAHIQMDGAEFVRSSVNILPVEIKDDGKVFVAKRETGYNIDQVMYPVIGLGEVLKSGKIPDRPLTRSWAPACRFCPMAGACDEYDAGEIGEAQLKAAAKTIIPNAPQSEPKITKVRKNGKVR